MAAKRAEVGESACEEANIDGGGGDGGEKKKRAEVGESASEEANIDGGGGGGDGGEKKKKKLQENE